LRVDEITLTLPADDAFRRVAHLVLGGLAVRLDLTYESLEDLELALDTLLERSPDDEDVTVRVRVDGDELRTIVGPVSSDVVRELDQEAGDGLDIRRILETVSDRIEVTDHDVHLLKRIDAKE
jgi:anti-sigma regulatory factor (Ser/Thr protein kinase)